MPLDFTNIRTAKERNPAGTKRVVYFAPMDDFITIGAPVDPPTTVDEMNVISTDHAFNIGKNFYKIELETDKQDLVGESIGEVMGGDMAFDWSGFATGLGDDQMGLFDKLTFEKHIVLVPLKDGKVIQLGEEDNGVMFKRSVQIGKESDGERGFPLTLKHFGRILRYDGVVSFTPAV